MIKLTEVQKKLLKDELGLVSLPKERERLEEILSKLVDLFTTKGLKEDSEPNKFGLEIDDLIGIFSKEVYK